MDLVNKDKNSGMPDPPVWATYQTLLDASEEKKVVRFFLKICSTRDNILLLPDHPPPPPPLKLRLVLVLGGGDSSGAV